MGLKSGSRDAGLDTTEDGDEHSTEPEPIETEPADGDIERHDQQTPTGDPGTTRTTEPPADPDTDRSGHRPSMESIPYKLRREKVNAGREQVPFFLREAVIDAEDGFQAGLEEMLGENVYKSDYREAAMIVAQRNPELVAEVLREWGYDLETR